MINALLFSWEDVRVRFIVSVLKTDVQKCTVGSNPTLPVILPAFMKYIKDARDFSRERFKLGRLKTIDKHKENIING